VAILVSGVAITEVADGSGVESRGVEVQSGSCVRATVGVATTGRAVGKAVAVISRANAVDVGIGRVGIAGGGDGRLHETATPTRSNAATPAARYSGLCCMVVFLVISREMW
jgi:hypothetical protein